MIKNKRIQIVLPVAAVEKFEKQAKKQGRSESNLGRKYLMEGISKDEQAEIKNVVSKNI